MNPLFGLRPLPILPFFTQMSAKHSVSIGEAVGHLLNAKKMANCRPRYIESLRAYLMQFTRGRESTLVTEFDVLAIESWFAGRNEALATMASNVGRLSSLFGFCERRGWIAKNPCKQLERIRIERAAPKILSPDEAMRVMSYSLEEKPHQTAFFALSMFAGVRPEELERIEWSAVDLDRGIVTIDAAASKVRRRRISDLEPNAVRWLRVARECDARLPVARITRRRYLDHAERQLGWPRWHQDCLRHTAASYLLAKHRNAQLVADRLGNSANVLLRHYRELVPPEDCAKFWSIEPITRGPLGS